MSVLKQDWDLDQLNKVPEWIAAMSLITGKLSFTRFTNFVDSLGPEARYAYLNTIIKLLRREESVIRNNPLFVVINDGLIVCPHMQALDYKSAVNRWVAWRYADSSDKLEFVALSEAWLAKCFMYSAFEPDTIDFAHNEQEASLRKLGVVRQSWTVSQERAADQFINVVSKVISAAVIAVQTLMYPVDMRHKVAAALAMPDINGEVNDPANMEAKQQVHVVAINKPTLAPNRILLDFKSRAINRQTALNKLMSEPTYSIGDLVSKRNGGSWNGMVVGYYVTDYTQRGYAVESLTERGSVQIYPENALAPLNCQSICHAVDSLSKLAEVLEEYMAERRQGSANNA